MGWSWYPEGRGPIAPTFPFFVMFMTSSPALTDRRRLWFAAIKPPMYSVAIIPVLVGEALAFRDLGDLALGRFALFLGGAIALIAWMNLSNDAFDATTGIDVNKAHSVVNLTGRRDLVLGLANLFLVLGIAAVGAIAYLQQDGTVLELILVASLIAYTYQGPPFRLGYWGIGELICFISFSLVVPAVYYSQTQVLTPTAGLLGMWVALPTSIILFCSHFHQGKDDLAAGKRSPIVRLGTAKGAQVLRIAVLSLYPITGLMIWGGSLTPWAGLILLGYPLAQYLINHVWAYHDQPDHVSNAKFLAVRWHFVSGMLLSLALVLGRS